MGTSLGLLLYSPFVRWRHDHAIHHASSGDLTRRGTGDIRTLTVAEYHRLPWRSQFGYRLLRNPIVMFGLGPIVAMIIGPRIVANGARERMRRSVISTNLALAVMVGALCWLIGWLDYLLVFGPAALLAGSIGIWLFYVQHQFEDTYWENAGDWNYVDAALRGSSFLKLPPPCDSSPATSAITTSITSMRVSPTTTCAERTRRTRSSTTCRRFHCGTACAPWRSSCGTRTAAAW